MANSRPSRAPVPRIAPRGRTSGNHGAPVRNPHAGPVFIPVPRPVMARRPLPARGRIGSDPGGPVANPRYIFVSAGLLFTLWEPGPPYPGGFGGSVIPRFSFTPGMAVPGEAEPGRVQALGSASVYEISLGALFAAWEPGRVFTDP